jgi:hypothetical protein
MPPVGALGPQADHAVLERRIDTVAQIGPIVCHDATSVRWAGVFERPEHSRRQAIFRDCLLLNRRVAGTATTSRRISANKSADWYASLSLTKVGGAGRARWGRGVSAAPSVLGATGSSGSITSTTPMEDQIRERSGRIIGSLQPIAASTGTFSDVRRADHITLAVHELETASFLASKLTP